MQEATPLLLIANLVLKPATTISDFIKMILIVSTGGRRSTVVAEEGQQRASLE